MEKIELLVILGMLGITDTNTNLTKSSTVNMSNQSRYIRVDAKSVNKGISDENMQFVQNYQQSKFLSYLLSDA